MPDFQDMLDRRAQLLDSSAGAEAGRRQMTDQTMRDASQRRAHDTDAQLDELNKTLTRAGIINGYGGLTPKAQAQGLQRPRRASDK